MSVRRLSAALAAAAVIVGASASAVVASTSHSQATTVKVTAKEFSFALSTKSAKAGAVTFVVTNKGKLAHDFKIAGKKTALINPGKTKTLTVTIKKGSNPYLCTVPGHAAAGMKGIFKGL
jgi:uncharacterized cupredoxin-like copper-binding protein